MTFCSPGSYRLAKSKTNTVIDSKWAPGSHYFFGKDFLFTRVSVADLDLELRGGGGS